MDEGSPRRRDLEMLQLTAQHVTNKRRRHMEQMRTLTDHAVGGLNEVIDIHVLDEPEGPGNACHEYSLGVKNLEGALVNITHIHFQKGALNEAGINGLSNEALLAVVIDRMRSFQSGQFACRDNAVALTKLEEALMWLQKRTLDRLRRGVEGTHIK